jgi:hypothetical protein
MLFLVADPVSFFGQCSVDDVVLFCAGTQIQIDAYCTHEADARRAPGSPRLLCHAVWHYPLVIFVTLVNTSATSHTSSRHLPLRSSMSCTGKTFTHKHATSITQNLKRKLAPHMLAH